MAQYGFYFDQSRCYGCKACSIACKDWYDIDPGPEKWMSVFMWEKGVFPDMRINILAFNCGHCDEPVCVDACENGAIEKEEEFGAVLVDQAKCQGDRNCLAACPYGAPKFADDEAGTKMSKCTMCVDRLVKGEQPVCVLSCPMRALDFGPIEELVEKYGDVRQLEEMPSPDSTSPNWVAKPQRAKEPLVPLDSEKVVLLSKRRGECGDIYSDYRNLLDFEGDVIVRNKLRMKCASAEEFMANTRSDQG